MICKEIIINNWDSTRPLIRKKSMVYLLSGETPCCCLKLVYGQHATVEFCCTLDVATHERRVREARGDSWVWLKLLECLATSVGQRDGCLFWTGKAWQRKIYISQTSRRQFESRTGLDGVDEKGEQLGNNFFFRYPSYFICHEIDPLQPFLYSP